MGSPAHSNTLAMVKTYARTLENEAESCKARGSHLRVHFKNTRETCHAIRGMMLKKAQSYLQHVVEKTEAIPPPLLRWCWPHWPGQERWLHQRPGPLAQEVRGVRAQLARQR